MRNIKVEIEYDGTNYCGWQVQSSSHKASIQETIERAIRKILNEKVKIIGSGRTDAGVHARAQVANFRIKSAMPLARLQEGLNAVLPQDIAITAMREADPDFHSRFSAKSKIYRYTILNSQHRSPFLRDSAFFCRYPLDVKLMQREARQLLGRHNFRAFCAAQGKGKNPFKTIKRIAVAKCGSRIDIEVEADGYLYNMVRNIAGTLIDVGRGRLPAGSLKKILAQRNRVKAGPTAPAKGLCLLKVKY
ncbi:MAG: tRNA pseudouridine(38-40) synthase TruA [Candidatus Omnitrophota bacterium]